jgi:PAS domain S-box-containing protein
MHPVLERQLRKLGVALDAPPPAGAWQHLLERVSRTYEQADQDRYLLERSLTISSREMAELYESLQQASQSQIAEERDRLRAVIESLATGLILLGPTGRVVSCNSQAAAVLGLHVGDLIDQPVASVFALQRAADAGPPPWPAILDAVRVAPPYRLHDAVLLDANGDQVPVALTVSPVDRGDAPLGYVVTFEDITDRRRSEQALLQAQKLESVGLLAAGVAHEFNNLLTVISASLHILHDAPAIAPADREIIDECIAAAMRGGELVRKLLAVGRPALDVRQPVALSGLLSDVTTLTRPLLEPHIALAVVSPGPDARVLGDPVALQQAFVNLVFNARDAMPGGGRLTIVCSEAQLTAGSNPGLEDGTYHVIEVTDTGPGIPPAALPRIFDPFFTTKDVGEGSGLGLSTVRSIVQAHGGAIEAESPPGSGATFRVCLPAFVPPVDGAAGHVA